MARLGEHRRASPETEILMLEIKQRLEECHAAGAAVDRYLKQDGEIGLAATP